MEKVPQDKKNRDTGMALVLLCLIVQMVKPQSGILPLAMFLLIVTMVWPAMFKPVAKIWFGLSHLLGSFMSAVVLSLIFCLVVTPVALVRRMLGADPLQLKKWRQDTASVLKVKEHLYAKEDLERPY